jgi:acetylglutamate kinase
LKLLIKIGGALLDDPDTCRRLAREVAYVHNLGHQLVVVHGGGKQMTRFLAERGVESRFIKGLRVTSPDVIDAVVKVFAGSVNAQLVTAFRAAGTLPVGLSGISAGLVDAVQMDPELGSVGKPVSSDGRLLNLLTRASYIPVVACIAGDANGGIFNVNADQMAVACAVSFGAEQLHFVTDVEGVRGETGRIHGVLNSLQSTELIHRGIATGGMQAKLEAALDALRKGVGEVRIAPGARAGIMQELLSTTPPGTRLVFG